MDIVFSSDRIIGAEQRPNLSAFIENARRLERTRQTSELLHIYPVICQLSLNEKNFYEAAVHAFKWRMIETSRAERTNAVGLLKQLLPRLTTSAMSNMRLRKRLDELQGRVFEFVANGLRPAEASVEEKNHWLNILITFSPTKLLTQQLAICEAAFAENSDPRKKGGVASIYTLIARRAAEQSIAVDKERVRTMAEFSLDSLPAVIADRQKLGDDSFHTFVVNLAYFELSALAERSMEIRGTALDDPLRTYLRLKRLSRGDLAEAFAAVRECEAVEARASSSKLLNELAAIKVRIARTYLESKKKNVLTFGWRAAQSHKEKILFGPRVEQPKIKASIERLRAAVFALAPYLMDESTFMSKTVSFAAEREPHYQLADEVFIVLTPESRGVEIYLRKGEAVIKVSHAFVRKGAKRGSILTNAFYDGVAREQQGAVALVWEYLAMYALAKSLGAAPIQRNFKEVVTAIAQAATELEQSENRNAFAKLAAVFASDNSFLTGQIALDNRLMIGRKLLGFGYEAKPGEYVLGQDDLLTNLVRKVALPGPSSAMTLETTGGETIEISLRGLEALAVPGVADEENPLLRRYILELALTALIKLNCVAEGRQVRHRQTAAGYLIDHGQESEDKGRGGLADLLSIYKKAIYARIRAQGLLRSSDWYYQKGDLLVPLEDQSPEAKLAALAEKGRGRLFFPMEPLGIIRRLPVRRKKEHGAMTIAPWERNPLRVEQQRLFGDTRPLNDLHALYIITTFSDCRQHLRLYAFSENEGDIMNEPFLGTIDRKLNENKFRDPEYLFKGTKRATREALVQGLRSGNLTITGQKYELFYPIQRTICRPAMESIAALMDKGFVLE